MAKDHGPPIKDDEVYARLRDEGYGKAKAAAISNAQANDEINEQKEGGLSGSYTDWTHDELYERAQELDIESRSHLNKKGLIAALRCNNMHKMDVSEGDTVKWDWGQGTASGTVETIFTRTVTRTIRGTEITRHASDDEPAFLIVQDDGDEVLKSCTEVRVT